MTDKELLEYAAKAAGLRVGFEPDGKERGRYDLYWSRVHSQLVWHNKSTGSEYPEPLFWNPLTGDGDAFRLMVKLRLPFRDGLNGTVETGNERSGRPIWELWGDDPLAATRRAIVRAAAEVGRKL